MLYRLKKCSSVYAFVALFCYSTTVPMSHSSKGSAPANTVTLLCQDGQIPLSRSFLYLIPVIENIVNDMGTDTNLQIPLMFNKQEVQVIIRAVEELHVLLSAMEQETLEKYKMVKKYTPDDIPLHTRRIVQSYTNGFNAQTYANVLAAASYMLAPYLVNALAGEWVRRKFTTQDDTLNAHDIVTFIKKHRDYTQEKIYYEGSIADLLLTSRKCSTCTALETALTNAQPQCIIPLVLPMQGYIPDTPVGNIIITSLVGWEFINAKITEYPKHLTLMQKQTEKVPVMSEFVELDETDSASEEELIMISQKIPKLRAYTFLGLTSLQRINLSNLGILTVEDNAFATLPKLQEIELQNNSMKMLNTSGLDKKQLKTINLYGNPLAPGECVRLEAFFGKDIKVNCNK